MIYSFKDIESVHLEITSKCNASCPQCLRNKLGGEVSPVLPLTDLSLVQIKKIFSEDLLKQLKRIYLCGNFGDPCMSNDVLSVLQYFREINPHINLGFFTNGGARDVNWWKALGNIIGENGYVKFGIDGLKDTNHLYRRGVKWEKLLENIKSISKTKVPLHWDFIVFRHNEHQINEARDLSKELGFTKFQIKKTGRFFSNSKLKGKEEQEVRNRKTGEVEYLLEKPVNTEFQNNSLMKEQEIISEYGSFENYLERTDISCKVAAEKSIYISAEGLVFPCCWTAIQTYIWYLPEWSTTVCKMIDKIGGKDSINATLFSIGSIVEGPFFNLIRESWSIAKLKDGRLKPCAKTCGKVFDPFRSQYK